MAKNGPIDLIFGKLVISNDFKRPIRDFLKILIFGCFFAFFGRFLYALDFLGGPGTINQQKIDICLRYFADSLELSNNYLFTKN